MKNPFELFHKNINILIGMLFKMDIQNEDLIKGLCI